MSDTSINDISSFLTVNETTEDLNLTPGVATYSHIVAKNLHKPESVVTREKSVRRNENGNYQRGNPKNGNVKQGQSSNKNTKQQTVQKDKQNDGQYQGSSRTLIIGDSIVNGINRKGLTNNVECQSVPGATIDTIIDKLQIFDLTKFANIVVYVGGNNASSKTDLEYFEEKYEQLITFIKNKNYTSKLFLCTSCPRGDTDVTDINEVILRLCGRNELTCIDTNADFYDKKNQLRHHFFKPRDNIHLSRSGIKRLLGTIDQHLCVVENFEKCVYNFSQSLNNPKQSWTDQTSQSQHTREFRHREFTHSQSKQRPMSMGHHIVNSGQYVSPGLNREQYEGYSHPRQRTEKTQIQRCMKCGLSNHATFECRHQKQVQCFKCLCYGHKDSSGLCWNI